MLLSEFVPPRLHLRVSAHVGPQTVVRRISCLSVGGCVCTCCVFCGGLLSLHHVGVPDDCNTRSKLKKHYVQYGPPFVPPAFYTAFRQPVTVFNQVFAERESVVWDRDAFYLQFFLAPQHSARVNFDFLCGDVSNFCQHPRKTLGHATNQNCEPILRTVLIHMLFDRICVVSDVTSYTGHKQTLKVSLSQFLLLESRARNVSS